MMQTTTSDTHTYTRTHVCNMHNVPTQFACRQYLGNKQPRLHSKYRVELINEHEHYEQYIYGD